MQGTQKIKHICIMFSYVMNYQDHFCYSAEEVIKPTNTDRLLNDAS